jgi:uncharacterized membrane protein (UPF0127 family)
MMFNKLRVFLATVAISSLSVSTLAQDGPQSLPAIKLTVGMHVIQAELAQTPEQRSTGLMFRKTMGTNDGMLFAFEEPGQQCFWMKNTLIPLSVAFLDGEGRILNVLDMEPQTLDTHTSAGPALYAIETNKGWFEENNVKPGEKVTGLPKLK